MKYTVDMTAGVDFAPSSEAQEVLQNVRTIAVTRKGSVPLDRNFGVSWGFVDQPLPVARMLLQAEIIDAVSRYEPRARILKVDFKDDAELAMQGRLVPIITVSIGEDS